MAKVSRSWRKVLITSKGRQSQGCLTKGKILGVPMLPLAEDVDFLTMRGLVERLSKD